MQQVVRKSAIAANNIDTTKKVYHLVVDGNAVLKSSLVNKSDVNYKGEEYGGVVNFLYRIGNLLLMRDFSRCVVCWDGFNSGVLRWEIYKDYKANRDKNYEVASELSRSTNDYDANIAAYCRKVMAYHARNKASVVRKETDDENYQRQRAILQDILEELFVRQYMYDNVEGDDLIAYYCKTRKKDDYVVIVTEDMDLSQLISDRVCLYIPSTKKCVTTKNDVEVLGVPHYNMVLRKVICGDKSDNIKGIKGIGEKTLETYFPQILTEHVTLDGFIGKCKSILEERRNNRQKPIKCLENAINRVTDGCHGESVYEVNEKIIDLSNPLLTEEAEAELGDIIDAPLDTSDRSIKNVCGIISKNGMSKLEDSSFFGKVFGPFDMVRKKEIDFAKTLS